MSTLTISNLSDGTTTVATSYITNGSAKAWVNFNGTGTIAIRTSQGVGSLTDNGTGDYTVNFSTSFSDEPAGVLTGGRNTHYYTGSGNTSSLRFYSITVGTSTNADTSILVLSANGDLA